MLGRESPQHSFLDAAWSAESLLEEDDFYGTLYREGPRLYPDEFFAECYTLDNGRPSVPPSRMMKLVLLQHWEGLSDRRALERMAFDLRWKAVLGMEVGEGPVAQSTLVTFRARLQLEGKMEEAFERFLGRAVEAGLIDAGEAQTIDSTAVWGRGAVEDTYNLIASAAGKLVRQAADHRGGVPEELASEAELELVAPREEGSLKGRADIDWSVEEERRAFLNEVVEEARALLAETRGEQAADPEVREAAQLLARILAQDLEPVAPKEPEEGGPKDPELELESGPSGDDEPDRVAPDNPGAADPGTEEAESDETPDAVLEPGREVKIRRGVARDRVVSAGDPEMRHGHKSRKRTWDGYKAHVTVSADSEFVTAVDVTPANTGDAEAAPALLDAHRRVGLEPSAVIGDMAYSAAELRETARKRGTKICARVPAAPSRGGRFRKDDFTLDLDASVATCPAGETTDRRHHYSDGGGAFVFDGATCAACHLRERCTGKAPEKMRETGVGRSVSVHPRERVLQRARAEQKTDTFRAQIPKRTVAERGIARLVRRGLRQARYMGAAKTRFQALATALAVNFRRLGSVFRADPGRTRPWTGPSRAAA